MQIISQANLFHAISDELPDLHSRIEQLNGTRVRRVDRFIQLCLAGSLSCCEQLKLNPDCGLVIATGCGTVSTMAAIMETVWKKHHPPKPLHFVNSLGNSACFYVARALGITGHSTAVTQENFSFEAALNQAEALLAGGYASQILVGGIDEAPLPIEDHRKRLSADSTYTSILEGSHWLLLEANGKENNAARTNTCIESIAYYDLEFADDGEKMRQIMEKNSNARKYLNFIPDSTWDALMQSNSVKYTHDNYHTPEKNCFPHKTYGGLALCHAAEALKQKEISSALIISRSQCKTHFCISKLS